MSEVPGWTWTPEEIRRVGHLAVELVARHLTSRREHPVFAPMPRELVEELRHRPPPRHGATADAVLADFARCVEPYPFGNGSPGFAGWLNSPPAAIGVFADLLASAMNPSVAGGNHAAVHLEHMVVRWFCELLSLPATAGGLLVSGGSMASLTALAAARHAAARAGGVDVRAEGLQGTGARLVLYAGEEGHGCVWKAAELLGIGSANVRVIRGDDAFRMRPADLAARIEEDLRAGCRPVAVVATAGTTNTGAIDPLDEIADVCRRHGVWMHVDGAYGAAAVLSDRHRPELRALARADSVALDPHKWLYVPVEAGLILVRDPAALRQAFSLVPPYLRTDDDLEGVSGPPWFSEFGFQQTRGFRALKVWMCLEHLGLDGYRALVEHDLEMAGRLARRVAEDPDLELVAGGLGVVCFRCVPAALRGDEAGVEALNRALLTEVQLGGRAFLSGTVLRGRFVLRACIVNPGTTAGDVDALVDRVREAGARRVS